MKKSRFGRSDLTRYSKIPADITEISPTSLSNAHLGHSQIGKVSVECRFLHEHTKWGQLQYEHGSLSAGIIHMEIFFTNLHDCVLESATIRVVLDGDNDVLQRYQKMMGQKQMKKNKVEVRQLGPVSITGTPFGVASRSFFAIAPQAEFGGMGGSVGEAAWEKEFKRETRWVFEGSACRHKSVGGRSGPANSVTWALKENVTEGQPSHGNRFRTAFVFANDGRPFFIRVEIDGALSKTRHQMKEEMKKVFSRYRIGSEGDALTTLIRGFKDEKKRLNGYADELEEQMDRLNGAVDYNKRADRNGHPPVSDSPERDDNQADMAVDERNERMTNSSWKRSEAKQSEAFFEMIKVQSQPGNNEGLGFKRVTVPEPAVREKPEDKPQRKLDEEKAVLYVYFIMMLRDFFGRIQHLLG